MSARPIIKDGVVINIVEIADDVDIVTKDKHKEESAKEDAAFAEELSEWREKVKERNRELSEAAEKVAMAKATLGAIKVQAASEKTEAAQAKALRRILTLEKEISAHEASFAELKAKPFEAKPKLVRGKRWFHEEGVTIGPVGGNIGDTWDGETYTHPEWKTNATKE